VVTLARKTVVSLPRNQVVTLKRNEVVTLGEISTQQDYEKYLLIMPDTVRPVIDFSRRMLLAGQVREGTSAAVSSMSVESTCEGYTLQVVVHPGNFGVVQFVPYYLVCDITDRKIQVKVTDN
jgi:hypothetical protein